MGRVGGAVITMLLFPSPTSAEKILLLSNLKTDSSLAPPTPFVIEMQIIEVARPYNVHSFF